MYTQCWSLWDSRIRFCYPHWLSILIILISYRRQSTKHMEAPIYSCKYLCLTITVDLSVTKRLHSVLAIHCNTHCYSRSGYTMTCQSVIMIRGKNTECFTLSVRVSQSEFRGLTPHYKPGPGLEKISLYACCQQAAHSASPVWHVCHVKAMAAVHQTKWYWT